MVSQFEHPYSIDQKIEDLLDMAIKCRTADGSVDSFGMSLLLDKLEEIDNTDDALIKWSELTTKKELFRVRMFPGHHYFFSECQNQVLEALKEDFDSILNNSEVN
ncbi:unnamed protein product [Adineta steineri]|uniref:Uncharacterized protein n=1 Tax=Adineta steineri TaxID=433720 RepID=A0A814A425_9BILA|nr:unnamed protein product [Adineta steineri]